MTDATMTRGLEALQPAGTTAIDKDLRLNLKRVIVDGSLEPTHAWRAWLALGVALLVEHFQATSRAALEDLGESPEAIDDVSRTSAFTGMLNVYYRFRHFVESGQGEAGAKRYERTGLRMNAMAKPDIGHAAFEMVAFAVSVLNGCEMCVNGHERKLVDMGVSEDVIHDLARLAALAKALHDLRDIEC